MSDNDELLIKLERAFQKELETQKCFYESKIELLKAEFSNYKALAELNKQNAENKIREELISSYETKLASQRYWYEEEIVKRQKETENWHVNNLEVKLAELKQGYEEMLSHQADTFNSSLEAQKLMYEQQLKPFKKIIKIKNRAKKILNKYFPKQFQHLSNCKYQAEWNAEKIPKRLEKALRSSPSAFLQVRDDMKLNNCNKFLSDGNAKISIIMPVYNVGKYLRQSLDSLISQTIKDIEIICIDDGSTDGCYEILEEYKLKDSRIKVIHKSNKGTGAARNDGLRLAEGEYIGFADPDDFVKPDMFEKLYNLMKEHNLDIAMCMPDGYDDKNGVYAPFPYFVDANFENVPSGRVFNKNDISPFKYPMCIWNKLYTKKLFDENHIDFAEGLDFEDHKVIFGSLLAAQRMYFIKDKLYVYRHNREGSILTDNNRRLIDQIEMFDIVENLMKETNTFDKFKQDFLEYKIHNMLYYYGMIKPQYKQEYYEKMKTSLDKMILTQDEYSMLAVKYPKFAQIKSKD